MSRSRVPRTSGTGLDKDSWSSTTCGTTHLTSPATARTRPHWTCQQSKSSLLIREPNQVASAAHSISSHCNTRGTCKTATTSNRFWTLRLPIMESQLLSSRDTTTSSNAGTRPSCTCTPKSQSGSTAQLTSPTEVPLHTVRSATASSLRTHPSSLTSRSLSARADTRI